MSDLSNRNIELIDNMSDEEYNEEPIKSWAGEVPKSNNNIRFRNTKEKKSIIDFDHNKARKLRTKKLSEITIMETLQYLVVRGKDENNVALEVEIEKIMKKLNRETLGPRRRRFRGGRGRGRGRSNRRFHNRGRGQQKDVNEQDHLQE